MGSSLTKRRIKPARKKIFPPKVTSRRVSPKKEIINSAELGVFGDFRWKKKNLLFVEDPDFSG
ncbi:MAG: hypothetical protein ACE5I1_24475 [bacterium]